MARRPKSRRSAAPARLAEPLDAFLAHLSLERGLSRLTVSAYESDLTEFALHCARAGRSGWSEAVLEDLESWVRSMHRRGHAPASLARRMSAVRSFAAHLVRAGFRRDDFTELARGPRLRRRLPGRLTAEEAARIMTAPDERTPQGLRDRAMLELMYAAGLRASEVGVLKVNDYSREMGIVKVIGKGNKHRIVPIGEPAIAAVERYLAELRPHLVRFNDGRDGFRLLLSNTGRPVERVAVWQIVRKHALLAGIRGVHPHLLRHSFATHLVAGGADLRVIQELLGHADIGTTQVYTHVDRSHLRDTIAAFHPRESGGKRRGAA